MANGNTADIQCFLTAYDPSDLPGTSLDPLGFEAGYLLLAEKILPGLTNVAEKPRYLGVLCAGAMLSEVGSDDAPRRAYEKRRDAILRLERYWALANVLASRSEGGTKYPLSGLRGVTYAEDFASRIDANLDRVNASYPLLSRQGPYGVIGIYGAIADGMKLVDRRTFSPSCELGERLATGFIEETELPREVRRAVLDAGADVSRRSLAMWGEKAHIAGRIGRGEAGCIRDALHGNSVRSRMLQWLGRTPRTDDDESELKRLGRISLALEGDDTCRDLLEAINAILLYERAYQCALLGFERLLWLCNHLPAAGARPDDLRRDPVFSAAMAKLPKAVRDLNRGLDGAATEHLRADLPRLGHVQSFLTQAAEIRDDSWEFAGVLVARHGDVQQGKFDRGRRKMPWLESSDRSIRLTMTRVGGLSYEAKKPEDVPPHPYRVAAADAFNKACRGTA